MARTTEERLRALVNQAPSIFFVLDRDGRVLLAEGRGLRVLGRRGGGGPGVGRSAFELYADAPWVLEGIRRALTGRTVTTAGRLADRWFEARFAPLVDADGSVVEVVGLATDITERRNAERALAAEREFSTAVTETSGALVVVLDREGKIVRFNKACERTTGFSLEEVRGRPVWKLLPPDDVDGAQRIFGRLLARDFPNQHENRWLTKNGRERLIAWSNTALLDERGEVRHVVATGIDITERHEAEEALRRQAARLEALAEASRVFAAGLDYTSTLDTIARRLSELIGDGVLIRVVSPDGQWLLPVAVWHPDPVRLEQRRRLLAEAPQRVGEGLTADVIERGVAVRLPEVTPATVHARMKPEYWPFLEGVTSMLVAPLEQRRQVFGHITLTREAGGRPYSREDEALLVDLAHRAAEAIENARLYGEARAAVSARDEFLSIASHELRTPLTALRLALENMRRVAAAAEAGRPPPLVQVERVLAAAERQGQRLEKLVAALLDVSRIHMGRLELDVEEVDLSTVAAEAAGQLEDEAAQAGSRIDVRGEPVTGRWDRMRLGQVVTNLLSNAVKYGAGRPIEVSFGTEDGRAFLVVRDQGIGIDPADQVHIFERFERAVSSQNYGGLGLGLFIVKRIVESHGGTIRVASSPGEGAAFRVDLPRSPAVAVRSPPGRVH
jgi:PAS domain S-box-containing protein